MKLMETKLKLQAEYETAKKGERSLQSNENMIGMQAKLPKLIISKFNAKYMDWP